PGRQLHPELGLRRTALRCAADSHVRTRGYSSPCCRPREKCAAEQPHSNSTFWAAGCSAGTLELGRVLWKCYLRADIEGVLRFGSAVAFFSLSLWCVGFPLPILLSRLPNVHNAIRSIGPKLGHPALQKTEGSDAGFSWWETAEGH